MPDREMSFTEHLSELRSRLGKSLLSILVTFCLAYAFHSELFGILIRPVVVGLRHHGIYSIQALQVTETIMAHLEVSLVVALILAAPYIFYQVWAFVAPGLYPKEQKYVLPVVGLVSAFFMFGVVFCYFVFLPMVVDFLTGYTIEGGAISLVPTVEKTLGLCTTFLLVFGIIFQLPLLMFFLSLLGVANYRKYLKLGRYFIVVAFIVGAIFTPPEPLSQLLMAVPICVLYYVGVIFGYVAGLIRSSEGESATPTWVTAGVVVLFGASVGLASYLWSTSGARPAVAAALPAEASFAVRAAPATSLGRAVLREASVPEALIAGEEVPDGVVLAGMGKGGTWFAVGADFPCEGGRTVAAGLCLVRGEWLEGTGVAGGGHLLDVLDSESVPVALVVPAGCAGIVSGGAAGEGVALVVEANAQPGGMASVVIRPSGAETGVEAFLGWWKRETARLGPGAAMASEAPLARMLAWAGPDSEEGKDGRSIVLSVSPPRAGRMLGEFVNALAERCR